MMSKIAPYFRKEKNFYKSYFPYVYDIGGNNILHFACANNLLLSGTRSLFYIPSQCSRREISDQEFEDKIGVGIKYSNNNI